MIEREVRLKEMLKSMEHFKQFIMSDINALGLNEETVKRTTVYPMAKAKPMVIGDYPVMQFAYEGMLPLFDNNDDKYNAIVRHYYYRSTLDSFDYSKMQLPLMKQATIIFVHYFNDKKIRDLDNRNTKYIQDAIRLTGVIGNDDWQNVWNMNIGYYDAEESHVQVYVVPTDNFTHFMNYLMENHEAMKQDIKNLSRRSKYKED